MDNRFSYIETPNPLTIAFTDIFSYIFKLANKCAIDQPEYDEVRKRLNELIEHSAVDILKKSFDPREYDDARFAVCAWVDETILHMPWRYCKLWQRNLLQSEYYGTVKAGSEFYDRLDCLDQGNTFVQEVYYLCLVLGFKGKYSTNDNYFRLDQIKTSLLSSIDTQTSSSTGNETTSLFESTHQSDSEKSKKVEMNYVKTVSYYHLFLYSIPPLLLLVIYFIYTFFLNSISGKILSRYVIGL